MSLINNNNVCLICFYEKDDNQKDVLSIDIFVYKK